MKNYKLIKKTIISITTATLLAGILSGCSSDSSVKYFDVTFDGNGGTLINGDIHQKVYTFRDIETPIFELKGYSFDKWNIPLKTIKESTTIKAEWKLISYKITYHLDGGINSPNNPSHYNVSQSNFDLYPASKTGYKFSYWRAYYNKEVSTIITSNAEDIEIYAVYQKIGYLISYELNGGSFVSTSPSKYDIEVETAIPNAKKDGYTFLGWSLKQNGVNPQKDYVIKKGTSGDIKLYAVFEANN